MSSTNRGGIREVSDYYVTPIPVIQSFLLSMKEDIPELFSSPEHITILDPCSGGEIVSYPIQPYPMALESFGFLLENITTLDIRNNSKADIKADYLNYNFDHKFDLIITNPPFSIALDIIKKALFIDVAKDGYVIMLLRLNFFGSAKRFSFWNSHMPIRTYVHSNRISFTGKGTDSIEYMHAVWKGGIYQRETLLRVI